MRPNIGCYYKIGDLGTFGVTSAVNFMKQEIFPVVKVEL